MRTRHRIVLCWAAWFLWPGGAGAQTAAEIRDIADRLGRLERENQALQREVRELREQVTALRTPALQLEERLAIQERRTEEQAQTKVEASQRLPIRITGMALANVFHNSANANGADTPLTAARQAGRSTAGGSFRQSVIGLEYRGTGTVWGGHVSGSLYADFFDSLTEAAYSPARIRTASIALDWGTRSISIGQEKPLFAPRDPTTFSYVGVSPLTASGNLWHWVPQIRFEQRVALGHGTELRAQAALIQTAEEFGGDGYGGTSSFNSERRRPGLQGRFEISHRLDDTRRVEVAPGFHFSTSHIAGVPVPSSLFAVDWFANPWPRLEFSGAFFAGQNVAHFGALRQGFTILGRGNVIPVHARGGWGQFTIPLTSRLSFNLFGGMHDDRNRDLRRSGTAVNRTGAANLMYRIAPNVIVGLEALQIRTTYLDSGTRNNNRYDLSVAYLF